MSSKPQIFIAALLSCCFLTPVLAPGDTDKKHIETKDYGLIDDAFLHGYTHNLVNEKIGDKKLTTFTVGCVWDNKHASDVSIDRPFFSVWTRDLYWGMKGWAQAGDQKVLDVMKSSIELLILAKNENQATGQSQHWPLDDKRFYIPQAYCTGLDIAMDFMPFNSESQAHFILMSYDYWKLTGDGAFIESIWSELCYVAKTIELMDTNGNSLPDEVYGSYDYQGVGPGTEEPWLCATVSGAYKAMSELATVLDKKFVSLRYEKLASQVRKSMNKPVDKGGLWQPGKDGDGYYINMRYLKGQRDNDVRFIPYENLGPIYYGMTSPQQNKAIFKRLDEGFEKFYDLKYGPMYVASAAKNEKSEFDFTSTPWLGFLDVYLRCKLDHEPNRARIYKMLMDKAYVIPDACFSEGLGIYGYLSGVSGRSWDTGNFFHTLITEVYGIEKTKDGIRLQAPTPMDGFALTELRNMRWLDAVYDIQWVGPGEKIKGITVDGESVAKKNGQYVLSDKESTHTVKVVLK